MSLGSWLILLVAGPFLQPLDEPVRARFEGWMDGAMHVSRSLRPGQERRLIRRGIVRIPDGVPVRSDAIQTGRIHRIFRLRADGRTDLDPERISRWLGRDVLLFLGRTDGGRIEVMAVKAAPDEPVRDRSRSD